MWKGLGEDGECREGGGAERDIGGREEGGCVGGRAWEREGGRQRGRGGGWRTGNLQRRKYSGDVYTMAVELQHHLDMTRFAIMSRSPCRFAASQGYLSSWHDVTRHCATGAMRRSKNFRHG